MDNRLLLNRFLNEHQTEREPENGRVPDDEQLEQGHVRRHQANVLP